MIQEDKIVCDQCGALITHVTGVPPEGWPHMHNLCSTCFATLKAT
jgi:hypothetical protein